MINMQIHDFIIKKDREKKDREKKDREKKDREKKTERDYRTGILME
jgi:hypothetical protein